MLVCAQNVPLVVNFVVMLVPEVLSMFTPHIFHICELWLRNLYRSQDLQEICMLEAPALEHFKLGVSTPYLVTFV